MGNNKIKCFVLENQIGELSSLAGKIDDLAIEWQLPQELAMNINLVIEEAVSNIITVGSLGIFLISQVMENINKKT